MAAIPMLGDSIVLTAIAGAALARRELQEALGALFAHFPGMELAEESIVWTPLLEFRGPIAFRVELGEAR